MKKNKQPLITRIIKNIIIGSIVAFRPILGIGGTCKFKPTCTKYAIDQLENNPIHISLYKITIRLLMCNPFYKKIN